MTTSNRWTFLDGWYIIIFKIPL